MALPLPIVGAAWLHTYFELRNILLTLCLVQTPILMQALKETNFHFDKQTGFYRGKVRDVYYFQDKLAVVAVPNVFVRQEIEQTYKAHLEEAFRQVCERSVELEAVIGCAT